MEIEIEGLPEAQKKAKIIDQSRLGFGRVFTDRMLFAEWAEGAGWGAACIRPYQPFHLDPSCMVFHYGQGVFEGMKAYKWQDGRIALFRPELNARRFNRSGERLCLPGVPEEIFLDGIGQLVSLEQEWIPTAPGTSLYIRPVMIGVDAALGVRPSERCYFYVILSPVGAYYASGFTPVSIMVESRYVRAVSGGTGEAKTGANYATSLKAGLEAKRKGFDQVLWLDGRERRYIDEVGAMNMFFVYGDTIVTPQLSGAILPGVTRDCIIELGRHLGYGVQEQPVDVEVLMSDIRSGRVTEAFGTGTAAVVSPVGRLSYLGETLELGDGHAGVVTGRLFETLTGIQTGTVEDTFGWIRFA